MPDKKIRPLLISMAVFFPVAAGVEAFGLSQPTDYMSTAQTTTVSKPSVKNLRQLIGRLKASGKRVTRKGKVEQPFFSVKGQLFTIGDQDVQVFEYPSAKAAEADARKVSSTGSSAGTSMPMWIATPHFFKSGRLIVLYVGESSSVLKALTDAVGPQFAGR